MNTKSFGTDAKRTMRRLLLSLPSPPAHSKTMPTRENMCSPHYDHVMVTSSSGSSEPMNSNVVRGPGGGFPTALAEAAPEPGMWEIMVSAAGEQTCFIRGQCRNMLLLIAVRWGCACLRKMVVPSPPEVDFARSE